MYGVVREFQAPLSVTHAARGRFCPPPTPHATVFARKNALDLYIVRANAQTARLELVSSTPLGATVMSLAVLRRTHHDVLVVAFDRMRLAILSWLHDECTWQTDQLVDLASLLGSKLCSPSSIMHNAMPDDGARALLRGKAGRDSAPLIKADPSGRCIAALAKNQNTIYVIPVQPEDDARLINRGDIFMIDLPTDYEARNVKDMVFLQGSFEPNLLLLHEPRRTWAGRAAIQRNTCVLHNVSIDLRMKRTSKTWSMESLPYDSEKLEAIPESAGAGALLMSASVILQVRHGACVAGLALNCFGDAYAKEVRGRYDTVTKSDMLVECDAAHCRFLDVEESVDGVSATQSIALLSLKGGELYFLSVAVGSRSEISMKRAGSTVIASEIVPINERFFVLASRLSDSLLVEYQRAAEDERERKSGQNGKSADLDGKTEAKARTGKRKKRKRTAEEEAEYEMIYGVTPPQESSDEESEDDKGKSQSALELEEKVEGTRGVYDDDDELGWVFNSGTESAVSAGASFSSGKWALKVKDTLPCFGPGTDLAIGPSPDDVTQTKLDMVVAGGYAKNGCLAVVHQSIRPTNRTEFEVPGCDGVWTVLDPAVAKRERAERKRRNTNAANRNAARRSRNARKLAERKRFVDEAVAQLKKEREELRRTQTEAEAKEANGTGLPDDATADGNIANGKDLNGDSEHITDAVDPSSDNPGAQVTDAHAKHSANGRNSHEPADKSEPGLGSDTGDPPLKRHKASGDTPSPDKVNPSPQDIENDEAIIDDEVMAEIQRQAEVSYPLEAEEAMEEDIKDEESLHSYMLLSSESGTTILKTGVEIEEVLDTSLELITNERTLAAGNVLGSESIVQVVPSKVRVFRKGKATCEFQVSDVGTSIKRAQVCDPLVLLETDDERLFVLLIKAEEFEETPSSDDQPDRPLEEEVFDEYGMALSHTETNGNMPKDAEEKDESPDSRARAAAKEYRNFSISVEFPTEGQQEFGASVAAAYLYNGPLAAEIAKDGVLSSMQTDSPDEKIDEDDNLYGESHSMSDGHGESSEDRKRVAESEGGKKEDEADQIEDEDRMLYGDDNDNEEDLMLYGTGESGTANNVAGGDEVGRKGEDAKLGGPDSVNGQPVTGKPVGTSTLTPLEKGVFSLPVVNGGDAGHGHLLVIVHKDGSLLILSRALQYAAVLQCPVFFAAPSLVRDLRPFPGDKSRQCPAASDDLRICSVNMMEVTGSALLTGISTPILVAMSHTGIPLIYRAFMATKASLSLNSRSRLTLKRIVFRDRSAYLFSRALKRTEMHEEEEENGLQNPKVISRQVHFQNIAGRGGLFVAGPCPFFVFAERGYPRVHPLTYSNATGDRVCLEEYERGQEILALTEFHNVKCPRGFVYVSADGVIRIAELPPPSVMNYDAPTPIRKISLRCTPHKVAYHAGSATYGVLASMPTLTTREERLARILQSLEKHDKRHYQSTAAQAEAETGDERANRVPPLFEELHELRVYRPDTWELIKSHKLRKGEVGLAIANMTVDVYKQRMAGSGADIPSSKKGDDGNESAFAASLKMRPKNMLVIGTGYLNGEDSSSRGRLLLFEVSRQEIFTEDQGVYTAFQMQLIAEKELFSPVTAVAAMEGYVIAGVGPQVSVYKLVGDEIIHLSFAFGQLYCTSLSSLKQYVVAADMCKSVSFMYFRDRNNSVNFLGKDYEHVTSYATEFLIENENMGIIVSDGRGNFQMMNYAHASVPESRGGKRLLINGGLHYGSRVNKLIRVRAPDAKKVFDVGRADVIAGKHSLLFTTLDGGMGGVIAVTETEYKKLEKLRELLVACAGVPRYAGVNPDEQTAFQPESSSAVLLDQRLLDSRAVFDVFGLSLVEVRMIAREFGGNVKSLCEALVGVDGILSRF